MTTKSHYFLGRFLVKQGIGQSSLKRSGAFLAGCVEPDINPATYLKGVLHGKGMRGHNYPNRKLYIEKMIQKMVGTKKDGYLFYYRLGKLVHYLTDAFTYPHNPAFEGTLRDHVRYEKIQERLFIQELKSCILEEQIWHRKELWQKVSWEHTRYKLEESGVMTDICFVMKIVPAVAKGLCF